VVQVVAIVHVFIAERDPKDALSDQGDDIMFDQAAGSGRTWRTCAFCAMTTD
jgi:hypothetical protein